MEPSRSLTNGRDADPPDEPAATDVVLLVDVANVMGSRPDGWWRDRRAAATRLLATLGQVIGAEPVGPDGRSVRIARVVAVVEGAARGAAAPEVARVNEQPTDRPAVEVIEAERDGDSAIVAMTDELLNTVPSASPETAGRAEVVFVVTADRGLRRRLPPDAISVGPEWLNRLIGR